MAEPNTPSKAEQLLQQLLQRAKTHRGVYDDWESLHAFVDDALEETLEELAAKKKVQAKPPR